MSSNKRGSMLPPPPKPPTSLSSSVTIPDHASLIGTNLITIHSHTVLHPRAKLNSSFAPITIGSQCIISERSSVGMLHFPSPEQAAGVTMENYVVVEVGAVVEASRIGEGTIIEVNARVGRGAVLGKHCKIGPLCEVADDEVIPDYTVIYGDGLRRIDKSGVEDLKLKMVGRQADVLRKLIPSNLAKYQ